MTGRATFGDFLQAAHHGLGAAGPPPGRGDVEEVSRSLLRVVTILGRYVQDMNTALTDMPSRTCLPLGTWDRARLQAREALTSSAGYLIQSAGRRTWPAAPSASPLARRLDDMATSMATGRDLLHTHFAPGPQGGRAHRSQWALTVTCEQVNRALLAEIGSLAQQAAHHGANVALSPVPGAPTNADRRRRLNAACQWLWVLSASVQTARRAEPVPAADRDLLAAIPVNALPPRPLLAGADTIPGLCNGVITTAERLRHLAWQSTQQPPGSPRLTVTSLRQAAETTTVTSHNCAILAAALATRTSHGAFPATSADLTAAAQAARQASGTWYQIARALRQVTTDTRGYVSPAAAEAHGLALWTGRLAYADPTWTLASGPTHPARPPQDLAPRPEDVPQVVAAVHHVCEALTLLTETEHGQLHAAAGAGRILVPTRTLPGDYDIPRPYGPAPPERTAPLLARYRAASQASRQATALTGRAAHATSAPSRALTTARTATQTTRPASPATGRDQAAPDGQEQTHDTPGPLLHTLLRLGVTSPGLLARGADLDQASQRLLIDAASELPPTRKRPPAATLNTTAGSAALLNHALASGNPRATQLLRQPGQAERKAGREPEPEPEP